MASDHETPQNPATALLTTGSQRPTRRRIFFLRRRKLPTVRLGNKKPRQRGFVVVRLLRGVRLRWLKLRYSSMLKKFGEYYRGLVKDLIEAGATLEAYQNRLVRESSFAAPVIGSDFGGFPYPQTAPRLPLSTYFIV